MFQIHTRIPFVRISLLALISAYVGLPLSALADHHESAKPSDPAHVEHVHQHGEKCGHKMEKHGDHVDYEHEGHHHRGHEKHVDDCEGPEHEGKKADARHKDHSHNHGKDCGHKMVKHGDHTDYEHDGHKHREHAGHVDECEASSQSAKLGGGQERSVASE
jgi:hypothetical protein